MEGKEKGREKEGRPIFLFLVEQNYLKIPRDGH